MTRDVGRRYDYGSQESSRDSIGSVGKLLILVLGPVEHSNANVCHVRVLGAHAGGGRRPECRQSCSQVAGLRCVLSEQTTWQSTDDQGQTFLFDCYHSCCIANAFMHVNRHFPASSVAQTAAEVPSTGSRAADLWNDVAGRRISRKPRCQPTTHAAIITGIPWLVTSASQSRSCWNLHDFRPQPRLVG